MRSRLFAAIVLCAAVVLVCMPWPEEEREHDAVADELHRAVAPADSNLRAIGRGFTQIERNAHAFRDSMPSRRYIYASREIRR